MPPKPSTTRARRSRSSRPCSGGYPRKRPLSKRPDGSSIMTTVNESRYPLLESAIETTAGFFLRAMRRYRAAQELRNIGENEISAIARDVGISQTELKSLAKRDVG